MLKRLKRKFLTMTMGLISLVLIVVFVSLLISTYTQQRRQIDMSLNQAVGQGFGLEAPKERFGRRDDPGGNFMTAISILADSDGNVILSNSDSVEISDDDLTAAISAAIASGGDSGHLNELGLYFTRAETSPALLSALGVPPDDLFSPPDDAGGAPSNDAGGVPPDKPDGAANNAQAGNDPSALPSGDDLSAALSAYSDDAALYKIAFVSDTSIRTAMRSLTLTSLMVGGAALALLFGICLFLADWALRPVKRVWNQQRQFISDASHELKTPLTVILANLSILSRHGGETVDSQRKWISSTEDEAQRMKGLVEDLLTLARLDEAGQTAPMPVMSDVDLSDAVTGELLTFEPVAFERGVELESDVAPGVTVRGDAAKLKQLTAILIDNACKYAGLGGRVDVKLARRDGRIQLSVTNTGDVIPPEQLSHVFERFYRADKARTGGKSGYGLGLAIAAGIARLHGGDIAATSDAEHGTVFSVTLPEK